MATRKVYFFEVKLFESKNEVDYRNLRNLFEQIIHENAVDHSNYKTLDLTPDSTTMHSIMDIFEYNTMKMFVRLSKQRPSNTLIKREYDTYEQGDVLPGKSEDENGIEQYTYGSLDFATGIFSFVSARGALTEKALSQAVDKFAGKFEIQLTAIPNAEAINSIYNGEKSEITSVEIEVPLPDTGVLKNILGWDDDEVIGTLNERNLRTSITIKPPARESITNNTKESQSLLDLLKSCAGVYKKSKIKAKSNKVKLREFDLFDENFGYPIEIKTHYREEGENVPFSIEEMTEQHKKALITVFRENKDLITTITGRFQRE
ncbi:hypothetical protein [Aminipila terrae]|uniref:Uncharacterized protein n=1 Tax=Aminipila terrae TaxID=2697030 RepID=A0A6P1MLE5_9FIRM|nr:hypothetical protein [Aminipila terrae]QHI72888.1 hypothetical protein Ami3637_11150 [Aminipila terrae]